MLDYEMSSGPFEENLDPELHQQTDDAEFTTLACSLMSLYGRVNLSPPESTGQTWITLSQTATYLSSLATGLALKDPSWLILSSKEARENRARTLAQMPPGPSVGTSAAI